MLPQLGYRMQRAGKGLLEQYLPIARFFAAEAAVEQSSERFEQVAPNVHQACKLSENLEQFQNMLETQEITRNQEFMDLNQTNLRDLTHFLKTYANGLRSDQPLGHELHRLQFVVPGPEQPEGLRRLVVKVGTAGGSNSHQLVYRCMQGLFREVGLSPNFIWDGSYEVPDKYLTYEHRKALEEARLLAKAQGIQAMQRGEKLPVDAGLKVFDPNVDGPVGDASDGSPAQAADDAAKLSAQLSSTPLTPAADSMPAQPPVREEELDDSDFEVQNVLRLHRETDDRVRMLAMSPWIRVSGEMRSLEEQKIAQDLINYMNELVPGFGPIVKKVWDGQTDEETISGELKEMHDPELGPYIDAIVAQLCQCTLQLLEDHGPPDAEASVDRKHLLKSVNSLTHASDHFQKMLDQPNW